VRTAIHGDADLDVGELLRHLHHCAVPRLGKAPVNFNAKRACDISSNCCIAQDPKYQVKAD